MEDVDIGEWKVLCKADEYSFSDYLSRLEKWNAIKITKTNIENTAEFKVKRTRSKYDEVKDREGNTHHPAVPALGGALEIKQVEGDIMLKYNLWIDKKAKIRILPSLIIASILSAFSYFIITQNDTEPKVGLVISIAVFSIIMVRRLIPRFLRKPYPGFTLKNQRVQLDYYLYQENKDWLE